MPLALEQIDTNATVILDQHGRPAGKVTDSPGIDGYHLYRILGQGGEGKVYELIHGINGDRIAVKTSRRAKEEYDALKAVQDKGHPGAKYVLKPRKVEGNKLVTDVVGFRLHDLLRAGVSKEKAALWEKQIKLALDAVHAAGYVHADVKPKNILITAEGEVRLADFGLSVKDNTRHVATGTLDYASENQVKKGIASKADDDHALAQTLKDISRAVGEPPLGNVEFMFLADSLGLPAKSFRKGEEVDWTRFLKAAESQVRDMDSLLTPRAVSLLRQLHLRMAPTTEKSFVPDAKEYRFPLAYHSDQYLMDARKDLEKRFERLRELAKEDSPDWEKMADILFELSVDLKAINVKFGARGGNTFNESHFKNMKAEDNVPDIIGAAIIFGDRPAWDRARSTVTARSTFKVKTVFGDLDLYDPRLLEIKGIADNVKKARRAYARSDVLVGMEEMGHLYQDLMTLTEGKQTVGDAYLDVILEKNPYLKVDRLPVLSSVTSQGGRKRFDSRPDRVLYTREADVYLFMLSVLGRKHVPDYWATSTSYPERLPLFRHLPK